MRRKFRVAFTSRSRVCSPATCLCGVRAQRRDKVEELVEQAARGWKNGGGKRKREGEREREREKGVRYRGYCFPISRALCMGIRLKPSYAEEDSRVTAPAGP